MRKIQRADLLAVDCYRCCGYLEVTSTQVPNSCYPNSPHGVENSARGGRLRIGLCHLCTGYRTCWGTTGLGALWSQGWLRPLPRKCLRNLIYNYTFIPHLKGERAAVSWWGLTPNGTVMVLYLCICTADGLWLFFEQKKLGAEAEGCAAKTCSEYCGLFIEWAEPGPHVVHSASTNGRQQGLLYPGLGSTFNL